MTTISGYSFRSSSGNYALVSKAPIRKPAPPTRYSRCVEKLDVTNVSPSQNMPDANDLETNELQGPWKLQSIEKTSRKFATAALAYLQEQGQNYKLVKLGFYEGAVIGNGALFHYNFKAKRADDSCAPVETFFAQLRFFRGPTSALEHLTVNCCISLGNSVSLPDERDNCGCGYCTKFVHHPVDGCSGILWGSREKDQIPRKRKRKSRVV